MIVVCGEALIDMKWVSAPCVEVVGPIGAGDAFGAALLAWLHDHGALKADLAHGAADLESALGFAGAEHPRRAALMH